MIASTKKLGCKSFNHHLLNSHNNEIEISMFTSANDQCIYLLGIMPIFGLRPTDRMIYSLERGGHTKPSMSLW